MLLPIRISTKMATCNRNSLLASSHLWQAYRATRKRESPSPCCSRLTFRYFPKCGACSRASYESKNLILEQLIDIEVTLFSNTRTIRKATSPQISLLFFFTLHDRSIDRNVNAALAKAWKFVLNSSLYLRTYFHSYKYIAEIECEMKTPQCRGINADHRILKLTKTAL